jgi:hypothetical protein
MKDITSTSFGLLIAFLLPGVLGLLGLAFWLPVPRQLFRTFLTAQSNVGLFLLVILVSLIIGLMVAAIRGLVFEHWVCRRDRLAPTDFARLAAEARLVAFRAAVDEHYRYHQFWGGMTIVLPASYIFWISESWMGMSPESAFVSLAIVAAGEGVSIWAAIVAYKTFVVRAREILKGG